MAESMIIALAALQAIDTDIDRVGHEIAALTSALVDESAVSAARTQMLVAQRNAKAAHDELRAAEESLADTERKIARNEQRQRSGVLTTPKDLTAIEHELTFLRQARGTQDERVLLAMDAHETTATAKVDAEQHFATTERERTVEHEQQVTQLAAAKQRQTLLTAQRGTAAANTDPAILARYEGIRKTRQKAVVSVINGVCQGCRVALLANVAVKIRTSREEIVTCTNCGRILIAG